MGNYLETAPMARELIDFRKGEACHSYTCSHDRKAGPEMFVPRTATVALCWIALLSPSSTFVIYRTKAFPTGLTTPHLGPQSQAVHHHHHQQQQ